MNNTTPEGFRTAAYLAAKARLDARKTTRNVQCNPPNVRCGNRCIPPSWDCRLKGQGTDPHLRAVKTDPLGGLANIQRGASRITRGIVRGNFSEVEGGKRAIIRGTVKVAPGNIQQKKELQKKLEDRTRAIGIGLAVVTGGLGIHAILMKNNTFGYRNGTGRRINEAVHNGVSSVLDATPFLGAARARTRVGAFGSASEAVTRAARAPQAGPDALVAGFPSNAPATLRSLQNLNIGATNRNGSSNLAAATSSINAATKSSSQTNVYEWDEKHRSAFWGAKVNAPDLNEPTENKTGRKTDNKTIKISVFARPAAEDFLVKQYNLPLEAGGSNSGMTAIKAALATKLIEEREAHVAYAKQLGLRTSTINKEEVINSDDLNTYLLQLNRRSGLTGSTTKAVKDASDTHIAELMTGKSLSTRASRIYGDTVLGFDKLYGEVAEKVASIPGAASLSTAAQSSASSEGAERSTSTRQRVAPAIPQGSQDLLVSLDRVRVGDMARQLGLPRSSVNGPAHAELIKSAYFANRVVRTDKTNRARFFITDRLALSAASELAGRPITTTADAMRLLQSEYGFTGAVRVRSPREATPRPAAPSAAGQPRAARRRLRSRSELIRTLTQGGLSPEAAAAEADRIISRRGDEDDVSPELVRTATYLAARADFKEGGRLGKPCGASHIPKAHECRKGQGASAPESDQKRKAATIAAVAGGVVAIAVAGSVAYNLKTLSDPTKSPLAPSPGIKDLVKSMKQEAGTKSASEAMGYYYTKKSGLKPGDVVYFRNEKDPAAHFGIYLGEGKDGKVRAVIANTNKSRFSWTDVAEIGTTKPGVKTSQALMTPLVKAPDPKFKAKTGTPFTSEEVVKRAIRIAGTDYKFSLTKDNCEALANGIAYGVPESEQLQRFRRATRAVVDVGVSRGQRREGREAIYQGRAQGRSYTAPEFVTFLQGQREFSSPAGKDLAKQYAQYFEGSRLDAQRAGGGLISPEELWSRIKSYGPAVRAQAMADYLLIQRSLVEMDRGRR